MSVAMLGVLYTFRNYHVAAPLKLRRVAARRHRPRPFRNYHVAAPLKQARPRTRRPRGRPSATIMLRPH